jgi:hypothetical protein
MISWENAIEKESIYWDRYASEIGTLSCQEDYMKILDIYNDYWSKYGGIDLDFRNKNIIDVGGGPTSILLRGNGGSKRTSEELKNSWTQTGSVKSLNVGVVIDPLNVAEYVKIRYEHFGVRFINEPAENIDKFYNERNFFDDCIIYNCLQHVINPLEILDKVSKVSKVIRICEPINVPTDEMHLHMFDVKYFTNFFTSDRFECIKSGTCFIGCDHFYGIFKVI